MLPHDELVHFWEVNASDIARHHCGGLSAWARFVDDHLLGHLHTQNCQSALEWGCGSGDIALQIARRGLSVSVADILQQSLDRAELTLMMEGLAIQDKVVLSDLDAVTMSSYDALVSVAVVQHFPSYAYWQKVAAIWRSIAPRTIILQTRHSPVIREPENYAATYLFSLWLPTAAVLAEFPGYELVFHTIDRPTDYLWDDEAGYEFFVLQSRQ